MSAAVEAGILTWLGKLLYGILFGWAVWVSKRLVGSPTDKDLEQATQRNKEYVDLKVDPLKEDMHELKSDVKEIKNLLIETIRNNNG